MIPTSLLRLTLIFSLLITGLSTVGNSAEFSKETIEILKEAGDTLSVDQLGDLYGTTAFYVSQEKSLNIIKSRFPDLRENAADAQIEFNQRFGASYRNIRRVLDELHDHSPDMQRQWDNLMDAVEIAAKSTEIDKLAAGDFINTVSNRAKGEMPINYLRKLLEYNTSYIKTPHQEFIDGFTREFRSDGSGNANGVRIGFQYPASWVEKPGRRPHIVRKFSRRSGDVALIATIQVRSSDITGIDLDSMRAFAESSWGQEFDEMTHLSSRETKIAGKIALEQEYSAGERTPAGYMHLRMMSYIFVDNRELIQVNLGVGSRNKLSAQEYAKFKPLFLVMASSIELFDRFDEDHNELGTHDNEFLYTSIDDGFSVIFPEKPEIETFANPDHHVIIRQYQQSRDLGNQNFVIYRITVSTNTDGFEVPVSTHGDWVDRALSASQRSLNAKEILRKQTSFPDNNQAIYTEFQLSLMGMMMYAKRYCFIIGSRYYSVGILYPPAAASAADDFLSNFADSFQIEESESEPSEQLGSAVVQQFDGNHVEGFTYESAVKGSITFALLMLFFAGAIGCWMKGKERNLQFYRRMSLVWGIYVALACLGAAFSGGGWLLFGDWGILLFLLIAPVVAVVVNRSIWQHCSSCEPRP